MKPIKQMTILLCAIIVILGKGMSARADTIYDSPYVTFSPDGMAWTTNAGEQTIVCYREDGTDDVCTGKLSSLKSLEAGEHYYPVTRVGSIPVGRWKVHKSRVNCCHMAYPDGDSYHGIPFSRGVCLKLHFSAWWPVCADCGQLLVKMNFYMSAEAARSLGYMEAGMGKCYYYLCPFNRNLEQGSEIPAHSCKAVSSNRYRVEYLANTGEDSYRGYMEPSFHMYNNAEEYEGREVTPQTHLNKNVYGRIGWIFVGWNTRADGTGIFYEDEAEIYNLAEGDYLQNPAEGNIKLYAVWKRATGTLEIHPGEGMYCGRHEPCEVNGKYGEQYEFLQESILPPAGNRVTFETNGGEEIPPIQGTMIFREWCQVGDWNGKLQDNIYFFPAVDGNRDCVKALYEDTPITLPTPKRDGWSFGGWYYDAAFREYAGKAGEEITPGQDVILYAQWAELILNSEDNYKAYNGCGAVNLTWEQKDGTAKAYKIYQSEDGITWINVGSGADIGEMNSFQKQSFYCGEEEVLSIPRTGWYRLTAYGAQGGNCGEYSGGKGGMVQGSFWLQKDEQIRIKAGGQNGFNGGGAGTHYATGGGCTTVTSSVQGILMVAGGGGGAAPNGNGGDGGSSQSLVAYGMAGESGGSGGGGGLLGGRAGELIVHHHVWGVCNHVHTGTPAVYGGCYHIPISCGKELEHVYTGSEYWSWGGSDTDYCPNCGADASKGEDCTGHETEHYDHVCPEHGVQESNINAYTPVYCTRIAYYAPDCGRTEDYICGYPYDGYVVSSKSAFGGSSYVAPYSRAVTLKPGVRQGNGSLEIVAEDIGYVCELRMDDVYARDKEAPEKIPFSSVRKTPLDERTIWVDWDAPKDCGSSYLHRVESYLPDTSTKISDSNITRNCLVSGVNGYYWCVNSLEDTAEIDAACRRISGSGVRVQVTNQLQYLHIWAVDVADNVSEPIHIPIGGAWDETVQWPIRTKQLHIWNGGNVHTSEYPDTYYVRCDGRTPFVLDYAAYIDGMATWKYQPDYAIIESSSHGGKTNHQIYVPKSDHVGNRIYSAADMSFLAEEDSYLLSGNYTRAMRSEQNKNLSVTQELLLKSDAHKKRINLIPIAGVEYRGQLLFSDYSLDVENGLTIIGDGEAPVITGLEDFVKLLDRRDGEKVLTVTAWDDVSGVEEFYLKIQNEDNGIKKIYYPDERGEIQLNITLDEPIFSGDFSVTAYARDYVGNESQISRDTTEFDLQTGIKNYNGGEDALFQRGEYAVLNITTWGYAERVEIELPEGLSGGDEKAVFMYEYDPKPDYRQEEWFEFGIPLYAPENEQYFITVRAYKGDKQLERYPALTVVGVSGSVLDDFRTRLR